MILPGFFICLTIHISPIFSHNNHTDKQTAAANIKLLYSSDQIRKMQEEKDKMKATGIVRRIDDLGRVVIPKEIRKTLKIKEGTPLEIFTDREGQIILKKYSPIGELNNFAEEYAEALVQTTGLTACITDRDVVVAAAGSGSRELDGKEISRESGKNRGIRHALTVEQQRAFMEYIANHPIYYHWWPMFTVLLGTGCRIGEALGLRWQDLDYDRRTISINHSLSYYQKPESNKSVLRISKPKTEAGIRTIPMLDVVKDSFEMLYEEQLENGFNETEIDGMSGFIFCNRFGTVPNPQTVNHTIKRIANSYNADEVVRAKKERRDPIILPNFSCHHLRHTFCTRLCENETNLKVIQSIMGHRNIETTMDIYAEATEEKKQESFENLATKLDVF